MEKLCLSSTQSPTISHPFLTHLNPVTRARKRVNFPLNFPKKFIVFASKDDPDSVIDSNSNNNSKFNEWELMELQFGKMIGEDPKLTLAKVMGRKINPDASFLEIEKNFYRNKGKMVEVKEIPFDVPAKLGAKQVANGLKLVKPVPKKGIKVGGGENTKLPEIKRPSGSIKSNSAGAKSSVPNVILRKPSVVKEDDDEKDSSSRLRLKPNLSLSMRTEPVMENFSGMTLLKRPQPSLIEEEPVAGNDNSVPSGSIYDRLTDKPVNDIKGDEEKEDSFATGSGEVPLLKKPRATLSQNTGMDVTKATNSELAGVVDDIVERFTESVRDLYPEEGELGEGSQSEMQHLEQNDSYPEKVIGAIESPTENANSGSAIESVLLGRPKRLEHPRKEMTPPVRPGTVSTYPEGFDSEGGAGKVRMSRSLGESEEKDWTRIEQQFKLGDRVDVELISCSPRGFVASFGSLTGFLPYRNLAAKWKFLAFESWLRKNDLDPSKYRQNLGIIGSEESPNMSMSLEAPAPLEVSQKAEIKVTADMELQDLLKIYDQEKIQYLSSYIGQIIKVNILSADKSSRKLIFSMRPKEKEEIVEKKRSLMAKLTVGDVVKCSVKKITYFGIFVEIEGVPALVHQTEVSWNGSLDPASYPKLGQIVEAKVLQLDYAVERIFLSLKEITPDPLNEALECIVGNCDFNDRLEAAQADSEWPEVDSLIKELQEIDGVQTVTKGRFFLSPGLAPTFQVYMASMFENQYKLLARSANKVQEVLVQASLDKEEMKSAILKGTNGVEL